MGAIYRLPIKSRLKGMVKRRLVDPDTLFNKGGNTHCVHFSATERGEALIARLLPKNSSLSRKVMVSYT